MPPAKQPDAYPPPPPVRRPRRVFVTTAASSHAPCPFPLGTSALLSCCGGTRYPPPACGRRNHQNDAVCTGLCCGTTSTDRPPGPLPPRIQTPYIGPIRPISRHKCEAVQRARVPCV